MDIGLLQKYLTVKICIRIIVKFNVSFAFFLYYSIRIGQYIFLHGKTGCRGGKKNFMLVLRCHQLLSRFVVNDHLSRALRLSRLSDIKGVDEMKPGAVHRSPGICLTASENLGKPQIGECKKGMRTVIALNGVLNLLMG